MKKQEEKTTEQDARRGASARSARDGQTNPVITNPAPSTLSDVLPSLDVEQLLGTYVDDKQTHVQNVQSVRRFEKAKKIIDSRFPTTVNPESLSYVNRLHQALIDTHSRVSLIDLPWINQKDALAQLRQALETLLRDPSSRESHDVVKIEGILPFHILARQYDYNNIRRSVRLPLGPLSGLSSMTRDRLLSLVQVLLNRVQSIAVLPLEDIKATLTSYIEERPETTVTALYDQLSDDMPEVLRDLPRKDRYTVDDAVEMLQHLSHQAAEKYIMTAVLQPLFREALKDRSEFSWPDLSDLLMMAQRYNGWLRSKKMGFVSGFYKREISEAIGKDSSLNGLINLVQATSLGVEHNVTSAFSRMLEAVPASSDGVHMYYDSGFQAHRDETVDETGRITRGISKVELHNPFVSISRTAVVSDVTGNPIVLEDAVDSSYHYSVTKDELIMAVRCLAFLKGIRVIDAIDLEFISLYPEWSGIIINDQDSFGRSLAMVEEVSLTDSLPKWVRDRLPSELIIRFLNGDLTGSPLSSLFADINAGDTSSTINESLTLFATTHDTVTKLLVTYLRLAADSREWCNSVIWSQLSQCGIVDITPNSQRSVHAEMTLTSAKPVISNEGDEVVSSRYYVMDEALTLSPFVDHMYTILKQLGVAGSVKYTPFGVETFNLPVDANVIDVSSVVADDTVPRFLKSYLLAQAKTMSHGEITSLANTTGKAVRLTLLNPQWAENPDGSPLLIEGEALISSLEPMLLVRFEGVQPIEMLPITYLHSSPVSSDEQLASYPQIARTALRPIDPTHFFLIRTQRTPVATPDFKLVLPSSIDNVITYCRQVSARTFAAFNDEAPDGLSEKHPFVNHEGVAKTVGLANDASSQNRGDNSDRVPREGDDDTPMVSSGDRTHGRTVEDLLPDGVSHQSK